MSSRNLFHYFRKNNAAVTGVLLPGWATDSRVFNVWPYANLVVPEKIYPDGFEQDLERFLDQQGIRDFFIYGFSMGAFLGASLQQRFADRIIFSVLVGLCQGYDSGQIAAIKAEIQANKADYLSRFYLNCFSTAGERREFKRVLQQQYLSLFDSSCLLEGLDFLAETSFQAETLPLLYSTVFLNGDIDRIAVITPENRAVIFQGCTSYYLPQVGHIPFFHPLFLSQVEAIFRRFIKEF